MTRMALKGYHSRKLRWIGAPLALIAMCLTPMVADAQSGPEASEDNDPLYLQFQDPPPSARPHVWWHWMDGNVTQEGIAMDLSWMSRIGIGGVQTFDVAITTPQVIEDRLGYMTPEWRDAFSFAAGEADRLGLEMTVASSPGWSETGGPWVESQDGMKKVVWAQLELTGGRPFNGRLPHPPTMTGPFQTLSTESEVGSLLGSERGNVDIEPYYRDIAVLAFPLAHAPIVEPPAVSAGEGSQIDAGLLSDDDLESAVELAFTDQEASLVVRYQTAQTVRSARVFVPRAAGTFSGASYRGVLESGASGEGWEFVADIPLSTVPTTVAFAPVTAQEFRLTFHPATNATGSYEPPVAGLDFGSLGSALAAAQAGTPGLRVGDFRLFAEDRIDRAEAKAGFAVVPDFYALSNDVPEVAGAPIDHIIDLTDLVDETGNLEWTPPPGRWRVLRLGYSLTGTTNHPAPLEATGLEVDKFDGAAVRRYLEHYLGMYEDTAGGLIGERGVTGILTDSIEVGAANWTPDMLVHFESLRGYDPTPWLPALAGTIIGSRSQTDNFLYDYRRTLADLMAREHYGTIASVAHENGLIVYGEALEENRPSLGDDMAMRRFADVPMAAMWTYPRETGPKQAYIADILGAASVAHVYGQNLVAAESLTSLLAPWAYGPSELKRIVDLEFALGVNRPIIHTSVHQPLDDNAPGLALSIFGQYFNRHEAWAELATPWVDYLARNALMLQQGRHVADIAYFYGEEAPLTGLFSETGIPEVPTGYAFDFINAEALMETLAMDGGELVSQGGARYQVLYLGGSSHRMTLPVLRRLAQLVDDGATLIGVAPTDDPGLAGNVAEWNELVECLWTVSTDARIGAGRVIATDDLTAGLAAASVTPDFLYEGSVPDSEILFLHRELADGHSYFLSNRIPREEAVEARFRVSGKAPELWSAQTGTSQPLSYRIEDGFTIVPLIFGPDEAFHVVFRQPATTPELHIENPQFIHRGSVEGPWHVAFETGRGAPASVVFDELLPLDEHELDGVRYFSGIASYTNSFTAPEGWQAGEPLWLDLGEAREIAEVSVNGEYAGSAWHHPYRVDVSDFVIAGRNELEIRVGNLWVNRLIGDRQPGAQPTTQISGPTYSADAPLRRSGLIGPVRLMGVSD